MNTSTNIITAVRAELIGHEAVGAVILARMEWRDGYILDWLDWMPGSAGLCLANKALDTVRWLDDDMLPAPDAARLYCKEEWGQQWRREFAAAAEMFGEALERGAKGRIDEYLRHWRCGGRP